MFKIQEGFQIDHTGVPFGIYKDPRDNKEYPFKQFGSQIWMLKDLDYGTRVNVPTSGTGITQAEGTCYKVKDSNNYGNWTEGRSALYILPSLSWVAPPGWHVPTKDEWTTLQNWVKEQKGSSNGYPQKALLGKTHWYNLSYAATDEYGFGLLPQGMMERAWSGSSAMWDWVDTSTMTQGRWWTSTSGGDGYNYVVTFYNNGTTYGQNNGYYKSGNNIVGLPVRLIKDTAAVDTEPEIESISVTIPSTGASDNKLATEKATKDYVDENAVGKGVLTTEGSILVAGADAVPGELAPGEEGQILSIASGVPTWVNASSSDKDSFADSDEVAVEGDGSQANPYTFDLTGKLQSTEDVDIIATRDANISFGRSMAVGSNSSYNLTMETGNLMSLTASNELSLTGSTILRQSSGTQIYVTAPYEYHYVNNRWAVAQSNQSGAKSIQFTGGLTEDISSKTVSSSGPISETAAGPLSIISSGSTAAFKGAGPTTVESTGGAPVTVKSTGDTDNYSNLIFTPNAGTISVNASTADHTLSMFSKSVVDNNTSYAQIDLNDSSGVNIHTNASPLNITSEGGAPITTSVTGDATHYSTIESQVTQVRIATGATSPTNLTVSGNGSSSSITGYAKNIIMLGVAAQGDGTPSFRAGTINGNTSIEGSTINLSSSVSSGGTESTSDIVLSSATFGYTSTYHSGTDADERTYNTQVSATPGEIRMSIQNPVGGPSATHKTSSVLLTSNNTMEISNTDHIILSGVTDVKQDTEWSLKGFYYNDTYGSNLTLGGICTLSCATGPINITDSCGAPIYLKVEGDSTHYTTITENVTGLSASVTGASSPLSFSMSGSNGTSSISMSAKSISLMAATIPTDTGNATIAIGGPMIGSLLFGTTGVSLLNSTLPTSITTTELKLPAYNNAFDSTTTHKMMTYAYSDAGVELATFAELTNEQFGLDENTEAGTMFWVNMTGASADTPEVETLAPGSIGQVLTIGSDGLPEWANGGGGGMVNPMTSYGDIIVGGASGEPEALASGTEGQVLTVGSSGLEWATPGGGTNWYLGAFTSATRPSTPTEGQYGYDTTIDCVIWYIDGYWKNAAGAIV